jgi:hypothetical protein
MRVGERRTDKTVAAQQRCQPLMFFVLLGTADWRLIGISDGPVFDLQTGNLSEIDSIACDDDCAVGNGYGGYSQILAAGAKALSFQVFENSNGCGIKFENVQLRQIVDRLAKPAVRYGQGLRG